MSKRKLEEHIKRYYECRRPAEELEDRLVRAIRDAPRSRIRPLALMCALAACVGAVALGLWFAGWADDPPGSRALVHDLPQPALPDDRAPIAPAPVADASHPPDTPPTAAAEPQQAVATGPAVQTRSPVESGPVEFGRIESDPGSLESVADAPAVVQRAPKRRWRMNSLEPKESLPPAPDLLAVRVRADWCGRCRMVDPIFARLRERYSDTQVLFVSLDVTDESKRRQSHLMVSALGIDWASTREFETGMIKLIDRDNHAVLATAVDEQSAGELETVLATAFPPQR